MNVVELDDIKVMDKNKNFILDIKKFSLEKGIITGLIGKNAKGKTTLINVILNLIKVKEGKVLVLGKNYEKSEVYIRERIGVNYNTITTVMKLKYMKKIIKRCYKSWDEEYYKKLIQKFNLDENQNLSKMSQGTRKLVAIILELSKRPELIILDEPTVHLDPVMREEILKELKAYVYDNEKTLLIVSHIMSDIEMIADYIYILKNGQVSLRDYKDNIINNKIIVKGELDFLVKGVKELFIDIKTNAYGFEALTCKYEEVFELLGNEVIYEKPNFEKLMISLMEEK